MFTGNIVGEADFVRSRLVQIAQRLRLMWFTVKVIIATESCVELGEYPWARSKIKVLVATRMSKQWSARGSQWSRATIRGGAGCGLVLHCDRLNEAIAGDACDGLDGDKADAARQASCRSNIESASSWKVAEIPR